MLHSFWWLQLWFLNSEWKLKWNPWFRNLNDDKNHEQQECIPVGCVPPAHWPYLVISHACPPQPHTPPATMHTPPWPCMPPYNHACPPTTTHAPPVNRMTNRCKNITLPQTSFAGGKNLKSKWILTDLLRPFEACSKIKQQKRYLNQILPKYLIYGVWFNPVSIDEVVIIWALVSHLNEIICTNYTQERQPGLADTEWKWSQRATSL